MEGVGGGRTAFLREGVTPKTPSGFAAIARISHRRIVAGWVPWKGIRGHQSTPSDPLRPPQPTAKHLTNPCIFLIRIWCSPPIYLRKEPVDGYSHGLSGE